MSEDREVEVVFDKEGNIVVDKYASFAEEVWDVLSRINVTEHCETLEATAKRPAIDYVPWHKAWLLCKREFPASTYYHNDDIRHPDETVEVEVNVMIKRSDGGDWQATSARLAVMDNWMNPIPNPTARQVNDSRQRVLVKALAFAGLGLNLWGHDTMPVGKLEDPISESQVENLKDLIEKTETNEAKFLVWCETESLDELPVERYSSARGLLEEKLKRQAREKKSES